MENINKLILSASLAIILTPTLSWSAITVAPPTDIVITDPSGGVVDTKKMVKPSILSTITNKDLKPKIKLTITNDTQSDIKMRLNTCEADVCKADASVGLDLKESITNVVSVSEGALIGLRDLKGGTTVPYWLPLNKKTYQLAGQVDGKEYKCPPITGADTLKNDLSYTFMKKRNLSLNPNKLQLKKKITCVKTS